MRKKVTDCLYILSLVHALMYAAAPGCSVMKALAGSYCHVETEVRGNEVVFDEASFK